jgi:DNA polymerase-3 subunit alpha
MLAREKAVLGFYITRHPLARHERLLEGCATATTVDLSRHKDGDEVILGGMVSSLRTVVAKGGRNSGKRMGILTIADLTGRVDAILFPDALVEFRAVLVPDVIVFLEGSVDRKREEPSLRVSRVITQDEAVEALSRTVLLDVNAETPIDRLTALLRAHPGKCPVYLNVETSDGMTAQIECNPSIRASCGPEFVREAVELLGREAVCLLGPRRRPIPLPDVSSRSTPTPESAAV